MPHNMMLLYFHLPIFMSQIVLFNLQSTLVLSFYIDVVSTLNISTWSCINLQNSQESSLINNIIWYEFSSLIFVMIIAEAPQVLLTVHYYYGAALLILFSIGSDNSFAPNMTRLTYAAMFIFARKCKLMESTKWTLLIHLWSIHKSTIHIISVIRSK